jgi:hypothetical protein
MNTQAMQALAAKLWNARDQHRLPSVSTLSSLLYDAIHADRLACGPAYDPETDARVAWARQIIARRRAGQSVWHLEADAAVRFILNIDEPLLQASLARCGA